ncbi:MAG TPA: hypothetical protein VE242_14270 [Chthoniobacterales bacterium]|nr:hypothetical protein [Chthoniobacterales bacterium]
MGKSYEGTGIEELIRVIDHCGIGVALSGGVLWRAGTDPESNWRSWQTAQFAPLILPHLVEVGDLAIRHSFREILFLDQSLGHFLTSSISQRSQLAAEQLLQARPPKGDRLVARLQDAIRTGVTPGHFVTLFAVRAIAFSIPARTTIFAYILLELMLELRDREQIERLFTEAAKTVNDFYGEGFDRMAEKVHG